MYERNAIVLERYFNNMFGYDMKNNLKTNFQDYCELIEILEDYKDISEEEENIMQEYDAIANKIRDIQKKQETLNKKNNNYQEERASIFQNIDDDSKAIKKKIDNVNKNIQTINEEIEENAKKYIDVVNEFNEKSNIRTSCGQRRREIENNYNKKLNETLDNYKNIDIELVKKAKQFIEVDTTNIEQELKEKIKENGKKEKIPFNEKVITKAIALCVDIQKRETDILANIYEKMNRLFAEIKNNSTKIDRHKKTIKDAKSKLEFIGAIKEYLIQFLDNERLTAVNGENEHETLMSESCKSIDEDLVQINNLYTLLLKEITKKVTKKSYSELYNLEYIAKLEKKSQEFESEIKKLHLPVTIINPNYWRIEGMKGIYEVFYHCVTDNYGRDLSEYMPAEKVSVLEEQRDTEDNVEIETTDVKEENEESNNGKRTEIDKKIDMILGLDKKEGKENKSLDNCEDDEEQEDEELEDDDFTDDEDDYSDDFEDDDDYEDENVDEEDWEDEENEDEDEEVLDSYIWGKNDEDEEDDSEDWDDLEDEDNDTENEEDEEDDDGDNEDNDIEEKSNVKKQVKTEDWGNEFININKKNEVKKKKGFFDKFKK